MNGSLQELIDLYIYRHPKTYVPVCEVYFKGRFEPYTTVSVELLLGDLLDRKIIEEESQDIDLRITPLPSFDDDFKVDRVDVAQTIIECSGNTLDDMKTYLAITDFLQELSSSKAVFSKDCFDILLLSNMLYLPPGGIYVLPPENPDGEKSYCQELLCRNLLQQVNVSQLLLNKNWSEYLYHYECDNYSEVVLSLLRYISIIGAKIKRCENCGRWFAPLKKADEKYCSRSYNGKSCKEMAKALVRQKRLQGSPLQKKYNSVNSKLAARVNAKWVSEAEREQLMQILIDFRNEWQELKQKYSTDQLTEWLEKF